MLAAEKIVKFLRGQGPGRKPEGRQSSETAPAGWLAHRLVDAAWVGHVRRGKRHRQGGRTMEPCLNGWPPCSQ